MSHAPFARIAAIVTLSLFALGAVACGGGMSASDGRSGGSSDSAQTSSNTGLTDETMQSIDKALNRPGQPLIAGQEGRTAEAVAPKAPPSAGGNAPSTAPAPAPGAPADATANTADRKIVQTATLKLQVKDVTSSYGDVTRIATTAGGFVSTSNVSNSGEAQIATLSLRVPANRYQQVLTDLRALGVKIDNETSNANDVTEEYADLQARQRNLEAAETQLLTLLGNARTVAEVLQVQDRLTSVRGQIEQAKGRQALLDKLSDLATISVQLRPVPAGAATSEGPLTLTDRVDEAWTASIEFLELIAGAVLTVVVFSWWLPIVAILAAIIGKRLSTRHDEPVAVD